MGLGYQVDGPFTGPAGEDLAADHRVLLSGGTLIYADAGEEAIGITKRGVASGAIVSCEVLNGNIKKVTASKSISAGTAIYPTTDGKVSDAAVGKQIGIAVVAATADGGVIAAWIWGPRGGNDVFSTGAANTFRILDHFTSGNVEAGNKFSETADYAVWLKSSTDGQPDSADVCIVADDGPGGIWQLTCNDANGDQENVQMNGESVKLAVGKKVYYETSVALLDVDKCDFFCGLAISDVDILGGVTDRVGFQVLHDGNIKCLVEQDNTENLVDTDVDIADCATISVFGTKKVRLSFLWDGVSKVYFFVNDVLKVTMTDNGTTIVVPDDEALSPVYVIHTDDSAGAVQTMFCDYIDVQGEV